MWTLIFHGEVALDEPNNLAEQIIAGLRALQEAQVQYDSEMWDISSPKLANIRHIHLHLSITVGKLAHLIEPQDHRFYRGESVEDYNREDLLPIVADLLLHAAQIANLEALDLGDILATRYRQNALRFAPQGQIKDFGLSRDDISDV